jgi:hypothetical protein
MGGYPGRHPRQAPPGARSLGGRRAPSPAAGTHARARSEQPPRRHGRGRGLAGTRPGQEGNGQDTGRKGSLRQAGAFAAPARRRYCRTRPARRRRLLCLDDAGRGASGSGREQRSTTARGTAFDQCARHISECAARLDRSTRGKAPGTYRSTGATVRASSAVSISQHEPSPSAQSVRAGPGRATANDSAPDIAAAAPPTRLVGIAGRRQCRAASATGADTSACRRTHRQTACRRGEAAGATAHRSRHSTTSR